MSELPGKKKKTSSMRPRGNPVRLVVVAPHHRLTRKISTQHYYDRYLTVYLPVAFFSFILIFAEAGGQLHARLFVLRCDVTDTS